VSAVPTGHGGYTFHVINVWMVNSFAYLAAPVAA